MLLFSLGMPEIVLIALVILLLFGGKKIPEMMKGLGKGVRSFKEGMNDLELDKDQPAKEEKKESEPEKPKD
ncbi:MAG: twin-arginine translocase TatA/TatE family subunit [Prevotella sp.]|nr:twin-arginine translocase TatA/TatE family subunit [Prevotella sp.]